MIRRRAFLGGAAAAGAATLAAPAIARERREWRLVSTYPRNFPGLGTSANLLAEMITAMSGGRLTVTVHGAGEIVPPFETLDAVASGTVEMGQGAPYYWRGKEPALQFVSSMPFGLVAEEQNAWFQMGGGQELADRLYARLGCKFFLAGNTGTQMGGWFNKEVNDLADFKGLRMRIPGLGGEVLKAAGANVINLPGGELLPAMQSGQIDAMEWVGPYNDLAFGIYKVAKYYYYPGWHEPASIIDAFVNLSAWEALPDDLKAVVSAACDTVNARVLSEYTARNNAALQTLVNDHGVDLKAFSDPLLEGLGNLAGKVLPDIAAGDAASQEVFDSLTAFRKSMMAWGDVSTRSFLNARALPYAFPG